MPPQASPVFVSRWQRSNLPRFIRYSLNKIAPTAVISYRVSQDARELFEFSWDAVSAWVEGQLPIFEESTEKDARGKPQRKITILDYAKVCDLHLPSQGMIIRFCDQTYEFNRGINLLPATDARGRTNTTSHQQWQVFMTRLQAQLANRQRWTDFKAFAETALDFQELLKLLDSHIYFLRREPTLWDQAFHLYSTLIYCRSQL